MFAPIPDVPRLRVLSVCIGNICRSPVSELLLRHYLGDVVESASAGTHAVVGAGVHPSMVVHLEAAGVEVEGRARQLTEAMLRETDLVLTMTRDLRSRVVESAPAVVRRAFTLAEFAAIVEAGVLAAPRTRDRADLVDFVALAAAHRSVVRPGSLDIADPYGGPEQGYATAFRQIERCVEVLRSIWG